VIPVIYVPLNSAELHRRHLSGFSRAYMKTYYCMKHRHDLSRQHKTRIGSPTKRFFGVLDTCSPFWTLTFVAVLLRVRIVGADRGEKPSEWVKGAKFTPESGGVSCYPFQLQLVHGNRNHAAFHKLSNGQPLEMLSFHSLRNSLGSIHVQFPPRQTLFFPRCGETSPCLVHI